MVGTNAARAQVDGVELEWRRAIDGHFSLDGFIANNRARFSSYSSRNPGITGSQTLDLRGNLLPNAPKWTGKMRSEEHTSELQSLMRITYAVFCLKNKIKQLLINNHRTIMQRTSHKSHTNYIKT